MLVRQDLAAGEWQLVITDVRWSDAGQYECQVCTVLLYCTVLYCTVQYRPVLTIRKFVDILPVKAERVVGGLVLLTDLQQK